MEEGKYITFKRDEFEKWLAPQEPVPSLPQAVMDAVVIRRQDVFSPPAFDAYANAIQVVIEILTQGTESSGKTADLRQTADYFSEQAAKAWQERRKLPD